MVRKLAVCLGPRLAAAVAPAIEAKRIALQPTAVGKYPICCGKKLPFMAGHCEKGMEGMLEVVLRRRSECAVANARGQLVRGRPKAPARSPAPVPSPAGRISLA
jgi:hypothetical protein